MKNQNNLVWMDLEMTGLDPEVERIIEIATVITDSSLNVIGEGPVIAIKQDESLLKNMDEWNTRTHGQTGLIERVRASSVSENEAEQLTLEFLKDYVPPNKAPLCGNSICQDRRFLYRYMPDISAFLHYRNVDISSFKELAKRWSPDTIKPFKKRNTHRALDDILESIEELKFYREVLWKSG